MPNHELCRANLGSRERLNQINEAARHNQARFQEGEESIAVEEPYQVFSRPNRLGVRLDMSIVSREVGR